MIRAISHVVVQHEVNLDEVATFLTDFGLHEVESPNSDAVNGPRYFRGLEGRAYTYVAERGNGPVRFGFEVDAIEPYAQRFGVEPQTLNAPGGGRGISFTDPDGNVVELVAERDAVEEIPPPWEPVKYNTMGKAHRRGRLPIFGDDRPVPVVRLAHVVLGTADPDALVQWYVDNLAAYPSDWIMEGERKHAAFVRFPRGSEWVPHHSIAVFAGEPGTIQHICFETVDVDGVFMGHRYLASKGYEGAWGVVRHAVGGAISDYWFDPSRNRMEHVTDSDFVNDEYETGIHQAGPAATLQWGDPPPAKFRASAKTN